MSLDQDYIFPSKVLLFGEYSVLKGGDALAIPYDAYYGKWQENNIYNVHPEYNDLFPRFLDHVSKDEDLIQVLNIEKAKLDFHSGLRYVSTIPDNMGLGSSGAFCAAFLRRYSVRDIGKEEAYDILRKLENFFHGTSSGIDPAISYFRENILKSRDGFHMVNIDKEKLMGILNIVDSGIKRSTSEYVEMYHAKYEYIPRFEMLQNRLLELNNLAIEALRDDDWENLEKIVEAISRTQRSGMVSFIPRHLRDEWEEGWKERRYMKLCGAGGGGMFLVFDFGKF